MARVLRLSTGLVGSCRRDGRRAGGVGGVIGGAGGRLAGRSWDVLGLVFAAVAAVLLGPPPDDVAGVCGGGMAEACDALAAERVKGAMCVVARKRRGPRAK